MAEGKRVPGTEGPLGAARRRSPSWLILLVPGGMLLASVAIGGAVNSLAPVLSPTGPAPQEGATMTVQSRPLVANVAVVGTIEPGRRFHLLAPFDGVVKEKVFAIGDTVQRGAALLIMDTAELESKRRAARIAELKAARTLEDLQAWGNSPDVARAKRTLVTAQQALDGAKRRAAETRALRDRGIVARNEYDQAEEQLHVQEAALATAKETLEVELKKANPDSLLIARLELENARTTLAELAAMADRAVVTAPVAGLILRPPQENRDAATSTEVETGSHVSRNQMVAMLASLERLMVRATINEIDVNQIQPGQEVEISGDAFGAEGLKGRVSLVSPQALESQGQSSRTSTFELLVELVAPSADQRRSIRVGMTSNLLIHVYDNPAAIVVPAEAIRRVNGQTMVTRASGTPGQWHDHPVRLGRASREGVEVLDGLVDGDVIALGPRNGN